MKKTLIINLRRLGDVYTTGHLINSTINSDDSNKVSMLVFKESSKAAAQLKHIENLFTIDRKEIITIKTNKIFSDGYALEQLFNQLQTIRSIQWDEIVNYSNDIISAYICSYLKDSSKKIIGVHFNSNNKVISGNDWEMLFNDIMPNLKYSPLHFVDCYHKMLGTPSFREGTKIKTNTDFNTQAFNYLNSLRQINKNTQGETKIIGIQLKTADLNKDIPEAIIIELIKLIQKTKQLIPVLLVAPNKEEQYFADQINAEFNNELIIVESDLEAVASVLMNIDLLITPDTAIKHIADLCETSVIEVSLGHAPFLKQGTYHQGSLVLTDAINLRNFSKSTKAATQERSTQIKAVDIFATVLYFFTNTKTIKPSLSSGVTLYSCSHDELGARYTAISGTIDNQIETSRLMQRQVLHFIFDQQESNDIYEKLNSFGVNAINTWTAQEKNTVTSCMKDLLGTLRSLLQCQENTKSTKDFVINLGKLIEYSEKFSTVQIPVAIFKSKIELINAKTFEDNAKEVEVLLYELKADIQKSLHCIKKLEERMQNQKKTDFINRTHEQLSN